MVAAGSGSESDSCESSGSVQGNEFLGQVKDSQFLHKNSTPKS